MRGYPLLLQCAVYLLFARCATISTGFDVSPDGEFDRYQTFFCLECVDDYNSINPQYDNEGNRELIRQAIKSEMERKGYLYEHESPDLLVDFHILIEEKTEIIHENYPMNWQISEFSTFPINYQFGTLVIHFVDRNTNLLVWQGTASKVLENPKNAQKTIQKAIAKILSNYDYSPVNQ